MGTTALHVIFWTTMVLTVIYGDWRGWRPGALVGQLFLNAIFAFFIWAVLSVVWTIVSSVFTDFIAPQWSKSPVGIVLLILFVAAFVYFLVQAVLYGVDFIIDLVGKFMKRL